MMMDLLATHLSTKVLHVKRINVDKKLQSPLLRRGFR